jgi:Ca2+-dependent lipid-binding protein
MSKPIKLIVTVIKGDGIKAGHSLFGKSDPYVLVSVGDKLEKTKVNSGGGTNPVWNEDLVFDVNGNESQLNITVYGLKMIVI